MITSRKLASLIDAAVLGVAASQPALADTFRFAVGFPAGAPVEAAKKYAEAVQEYTNKKHRVRIFELSLLNHSDMSEGINKGLADVGYLLTAYTAFDYPLSYMAADFSMLTTRDNKLSGQEGLAYSGTKLEFNMLNCEECEQEFTKNNQVYTSVVSTP